MQSLFNQGETVTKQQQKAIKTVYTVYIPHRIWLMDSSTHFRKCMDTFDGSSAGILQVLKISNSSSMAGGECSSSTHSSEQVQVITHCSDTD